MYKFPKSVILVGALALIQVALADDPNEINVLYQHNPYFDDPNKPGLSVLYAEPT